MSDHKGNGLGLIWVKYKMRKGSLGGVKLKTSLEVNLQTKEVTGFSHLYKSDSERLNKISCIKGAYSYDTTTGSFGVLFQVDGFEMKSDGLQSEKNLKLKMFLKPNMLTGTAFFEYKSKGEWHESGSYKIKVAKCIGSNVQELAFHLNEKDVS